MIDYIAFQVNDIALAKSFYKRLFNWAYNDYGAEYCEFIDKKIKGGFAKAEHNPNQDIAASLISSLMIFYSETLEEIREKVLAVEATIIKDTSSFLGGRRFAFYDPFGYRLAIWSDK